MNDLEINKYVNTQVSTLANTTEALKESNTQLFWSINLLRILGYCLLGLTLLDWIEIFISNDFKNIFSQFKVMGEIIERIPVPLIGVVLIFVGGVDNRRRLEVALLNFLSWLCLLIGVLLILVVPLAIYNTMQMNMIAVASINTQYDQKLAQANEFEQQVRKATPENVQDILKRQGRSINGKTPQELKDKVLSEVSQSKKELKTQAETQKSQQKKDWLRKLVKWSLAALLSGVTFISIWKYTDWVRIAKLERT